METGKYFVEVYEGYIEPVKPTDDIVFCLGPDFSPDECPEIVRFHFSYQAFDSPEEANAEAERIYEQELDDAARPISCVYVAYAEPTSEYYTKDSMDIFPLLAHWWELAPDYEMKPTGCFSSIGWKNKKTSKGGKTDDISSLLQTA